MRVLWALCSFAPALGRPQTAIPVAVVAVPEDMPEHPANDPYQEQTSSQQKIWRGVKVGGSDKVTLLTIFVLDAILVTAKIVYPLGLGPGVSVDLENLSMERRLADLTAAVRRLDSGIVSKVRREGFCIHCHAPPCFDCFLLLSLAPYNMSMREAARTFIIAYSLLCLSCRSSRDSRSKNRDLDSL